MPDPPEYVEFLDIVKNSKEFKILYDLVNNSDATVDEALDQVTNLTLSALAAPDEENFFTYDNIDYNVSPALMVLCQSLSSQS